MAEGLGRHGCAVGWPTASFGLARKWRGEREGEVQSEAGGAGEDVEAAWRSGCEGRGLEGGPRRRRAHGSPPSCLPVGEEDDKRRGGLGRGLFSWTRGPGKWAGFSFPLFSFLLSVYYFFNLFCSKQK